MLKEGSLYLGAFYHLVVLSLLSDRTLAHLFMSGQSVAEQQ
jgi:hypothetical protein